ARIARRIAASRRISVLVRQLDAVAARLTPGPEPAEKRSIDEGVLLVGQVPAPQRYAQQPVRDAVRRQRDAAVEQTVRADLVDAVGRARRAVLAVLPAIAGIEAEVAEGAQRH